MMNESVLGGKYHKVERKKLKEIVIISFEEAQERYVDREDYC